MFKMKFSTDNAAFEELPATETCRILRNIADRIEDGELDGTVRDVYGNTIGRYSLDGAS